MEKETFGEAHRDSFLFKARRGTRATSDICLNPSTGTMLHVVFNMQPRPSLDY